MLWDRQLTGVRNGQVPASPLVPPDAVLAGQAVLAGKPARNGQASQRRAPHRRRTAPERPMRVRASQYPDWTKPLLRESPPAAAAVHLVRLLPRLAHRQHLA